MQRALELAHGVLGQAWPNPAVGAVVVKDGKIIGEGATAKGGRPHAETVALIQAGTNARGATLYVTLEPCNHHGQTPPCTHAIINYGIAKCVIACTDPNPLVGGKGIAKLKADGIEIVEGVCLEEARETHRGFFSVIEKNRPFIALKIAASHDGNIASAPNTRTDITSPLAREHAMKLRAEYDAILTGIGTVLADDPQLNVRIPGMEHRSPARVVLDSKGRLPENAKIHPAWVYTREDDVIAKLTERGITRLLIEAGQGINDSFLPLADRIYWYESPNSLPGGLPAFSKGSLEGWQEKSAVLSLGKDTLTIYERI